MEFDFKKIEKKWQAAWEKQKTFVVREDSKKKKYYVLEMFPYPSGSGLHMGHAWNYTIGDILARFKKMQGFNVLHPMGYDALGLPAENAAIQEGVHPKEYTATSIAKYIEQQKDLGLSYDWSRVFSTADPAYYKWDQWIFLELFKKDLAYQKESQVNWCPKCDTVLANEQVHDGFCWRHEDTKVETKSLLQWFFRITKYAGELYDSTEDLDWPSRTKIMQQNWIGKSKGVEISSTVKGTNIPFVAYDSIPQTYMAQTFAVIAPDHPKLAEIIQGVENEAEILAKAKEITQKRTHANYDVDKEIDGIFTGKYIEDPYGTGDLPLWVSSFAIADYGSGMVGCSAHDQRDFDFAKKFNIPLKPVMFPKDPKEAKKIANLEYCYTKDPEGILEYPKEFKGRKWGEVREDIIDHIVRVGIGIRKTNFKIRDWGVSRQRYWGTPIPIIHCEACGAVPVPEKDLPVTLPEEVAFGKGNPLETATEWLSVPCPSCGKEARRETDTMDTFVNSSWYFLRYCDPHNNKKIFDPKKAQYWNPIDTYIGGAEHACMHLIYFRFYTKFLRDIGLLNFSEPAKHLFHQGMLHAAGGARMSKSKGNVVLPETVSEEYGIDTARFFLSSLASPDKDIDWDKNGIIGSLRFTKKVLHYFTNFIETKETNELTKQVNKTVTNITTYYETFEYRKATILLRELFNTIEKKGCTKQTAQIFLALLNPICPHITEELGEKFGNKKMICESTWPTVEKTKTNNTKEDLNKKTIERILETKQKLKTKPKNLFIYAVPFEIEQLSKEKIAKETDLNTTIYAVNDKTKHDPQNKAKKAKPKSPAIYFE